MQAKKIYSVEKGKNEIGKENFIKIKRQDRVKEVELQMGAHHAGQ